MVLGQVLHLDQLSRHWPIRFRAVKLEHSSGSPVAADGVHHGLVLLHAGLSQLLEEHEHAL